VIENLCKHVDDDRENTYYYHIVYFVNSSVRTIKALRVGAIARTSAAYPEWYSTAEVATVTSNDKNSKIDSTPSCEIL
jgi:hypothetical protein